MTNPDAKLVEIKERQIKRKKLAETVFSEKSVDGSKMLRDLPSWEVSELLDDADILIQRLEAAEQAIDDGPHGWTCATNRYNVKAVDCNCWKSQYRAPEND